MAKLTGLEWNVIGFLLPFIVTKTRGVAETFGEWIAVNLQFRYLQIMSSRNQVTELYTWYNRQYNLLFELLLWWIDDRIIKIDPTTRTWSTKQNLEEWAKA